MLALLLIRVLRLLNSSVQISFEFKHDAATKLVHGQGKARDVTTHPPLNKNLVSRFKRRVG